MGKSLSFAGTLVAAATLFSVLLATEHPALADPNDDPRVVVCTNRFAKCLDGCDAKFPGMRKVKANRACRVGCEDKILACEESNVDISRTVPTTPDTRCVRWGDTGYHLYRYCVGPYWLYAH